MNVENSSRKSASWYMIGNFSIKAITFLSVAIITRIMSVEDYGLYNTYLVYESLMSAVMGLGLPQTVKPARYYFKDDFYGYIKAAMVLTTLVAVVVTAVMLSLYRIMGLSLYIVIAMVFCSWCNCLVYIMDSRNIIENRYKSYIGQNFLFNVPQIILTVILIYTVKDGSGYELRVLAHAIPLFVILIIAIALFTRKKDKIRRMHYAYGLRMGLPLIGSSLSSCILTQSDRIIITRVCGEAYTGLYSAMNYISSILYIVQLSMQNVWEHWFYRKVDEGDFDGISRRLKGYITIFTLIVLCLILGGREISYVFMAKEYINSVPLIAPLSVGWFLTFLTSTILGMEYAYKKSGYVAIGAVVAAAVNIVLNLICIPVWGYQAAAYTTVAAYFILFMIHYVVEHKVCRTNVYSLKLFAVNIVIVMVFCIWSVYALDKVLIRYVTGVAVISIYIFIYRQNIKEFIEDWIK